VVARSPAHLPVASANPRIHLPAKRTMCPLVAGRKRPCFGASQPDPFINPAAATSAGRRKPRATTFYPRTTRPEPRGRLRRGWPSDEPLDRRHVGVAEAATSAPCTADLGIAS
jgi:hypothetical protein